MSFNNLAPFVDRLHRALDVISQRQQLVASNIANLDTPGYRTVDLDFNSALGRALSERNARGAAMRRTALAHLGGGGPNDATALVRRVGDLPIRNDGNDVNLEREMLALGQARGRYEVASILARQRLRQISAALTDGRG